MILRIAEFFRYMTDNDEKRLYYLMPIQSSLPYTYQHSSIRDVATICDILDLIKFFKERQIPLSSNALMLFESVTRNTLQDYHQQYQSDELINLPGLNIGDIGFFLFALEKCLNICPSQLPNHWKTTQTKLIQLLLDRQQADGSISIFFDNRLKEYEKSAEAFYLPECLIGMIATIGNHTKEVDKQIFLQAQKSINYCCQDENRNLNLSSDTATFYTNWQFQLLYHWVYKKLEDKSSASIEATHLKKLLNALMDARISKIPFENNVATVEIACYLEGLVHARCLLHMLKIPTNLYREWFEKEINRCIHFLNQLQTDTLPSIKGGFVHARYSHEARIDVAGHVFGALLLLMK